MQSKEGLPLYKICAPYLHDLLVETLEGRRLDCVRCFPLIMPSFLMWLRRTDDNLQRQVYANLCQLACICPYSCIDFGPV